MWLDIYNCKEYLKRDAELKHTSTIEVSIRYCITIHYNMVLYHKEYPLKYY